MNKITRTFIISNIISAIVLVVSIPLLGDQKAAILDAEQNYWKGIPLLLTFLFGFVLRILKAREVTKNGAGSLSIFEKIFLGAMFLFALSASMNFTFVSSIYLFGSSGSDSPVAFTATLLIVSMFILLYEAVMVFSGDSNGPVKPKKWLNPLYSSYMAAGIALSWDVSIVGGSSGLSFGMENFWSELTAHIFLALMMILSIQRLFWFEIFLSSNGWRDNLIVAGSLVLVLACAIGPLFFI
jgi:hypothetical protein